MSRPFCLEDEGARRLDVPHAAPPATTQLACAAPLPAAPLLAAAAHVAPPPVAGAHRALVGTATEVGGPELAWNFGAR